MLFFAHELQDFVLPHHLLKPEIKGGKGEGLFDKLMSARFQGFGSGIFAAVAGHHQDRSVDIPFDEFLGKLQSIHAGHHHIGHNRRVDMLLTQTECFKSVGRAIAAKTFPCEERADNISNSRIVVDNENFCR